MLAHYLGPIFDNLVSQDDYEILWCLHFLWPHFTWLKHLEVFLTLVCMFVYVPERDWLCEERKWKVIGGSCYWPTRHHLGNVFSGPFFLPCPSLPLCVFTSLLSVYYAFGSVYSYRLAVHHTLRSDSSCPLCKVCVLSVLSPHMSECLTDIVQGERRHNIKCLCLQHALLPEMISHIFSLPHKVPQK